MNSQLKKRPGSRFVREIPRDTRDGVALVQLVEVLGEFFLFVLYIEFFYDHTCNFSKFAHTGKKV